MNRRSIFRLLAALPFVGVPAIAETKKPKHHVGGHVSILEITNETKYKWIRSFDTEAEAIEFVQSLIPELIDVRYREVAYTKDNLIRSGYRGAIRYIVQPEKEIVSTSWGIKSKTTGEWVDIAIEGMHIYSVEFAWLLISNIRVNAKPVHLRGSHSSLPSIMIMPFQKGNPTMTKV